MNSNELINFFLLENSFNSAGSNLCCHLPKEKKRDRERDRERQRNRQTERDRERQRQRQRQRDRLSSERANKYLQTAIISTKGS